MLEAQNPAARSLPRVQRRAGVRRIKCKRTQAELHRRMKHAARAQGARTRWRAPCAAHWLKIVTEGPKHLRPAAMASSRLYGFDLDDNVLATSACIRTQEGRLSTRDYAEKRAHVSLARDAFVEFAEVETCTMRAAPCLPVLARALEEGSPVAIITARSNTEDELRRLLERASGLGLPALHSAVHVYCCNSEEFAERFRAETASVEDRKCLALRDFLARYPSAASLGFSDDDWRNLATVSRLFRELQVSHPDLKCRLYHADDEGVRKQPLAARSSRSRSPRIAPRGSEK